MKRVKNYIEAELAKKKIARYKYWSIKDENSITIISSDDDTENKSFSHYLKNIITDNVDAEVQVRYGTNEQSSRNNPPLFIKINEEIEWVEPEPDETVSINGVPHKLDKNGNVNINLTTPEVKSESIPIIEQAQPVDVFRQEMEMQLQGIRQEHQLKEERMSIDLQNKLFEQTLKFKEMMLSERENRIAEREQNLLYQETQLSEKEDEIKDNLKGYLKQVPSALGSVIKDFIKSTKDEKDNSLAGSQKQTEAPTKSRTKVQFEMIPEQEDEVFEDDDSQIEMPFEENNIETETNIINTENHE